MASVWSETWSCGPDVVDVDGAVLLMEMLDQEADDGDEDERLRGVIRSLEAEIGCSSSVVAAAADDDGEVMAVDDGASTTGPMMEDLLSDLDSRESSWVEEDPFDWAEMDVAANGELPGWDYFAEAGAEVGGAGGVFSYEESLAAGQAFDAVLWR